MIGILILTLTSCVSNDDTSNNTQPTNSLSTPAIVDEKFKNQQGGRDAADTVEFFYKAIETGDQDKVSYILSYFTRSYDERLFTELKHTISFADGIHNINFTVVHSNEIQESYKEILDRDLDNWHLVLTRFLSL